MTEKTGFLLPMGTRQQIIERLRSLLTYLCEHPQEIDDLAVQFEPDGCDVGVAEAGEAAARLVDGESRDALPVFVDRRAEGRVEHDGRVVPVHAFGDGVVAHQVDD